MITESEIITALSGSILGDYPAVIDQQTARLQALDIFRKILDIDVNDGEYRCEKNQKHFVAELFPVWV